MAKLSTQIRSDTTPVRLTRTQRKRIEQSTARQAKIQTDVSRAKERLREQEFTLENYEKFYSTLNPSTREYFANPKEVKSARDAEVVKTKEDVQGKLISKRQELLDLRKQEEDEIQELKKQYQERVSGTSGKKRDNIKAWLNRKEEAIDKRYDLKRAKVTGEIRGYEKSLNSLQRGDFTNYGAIEKYATSYGSYYQDRKEQRRELNKTRLEIEKLERQGYKPQAIIKSDKGQTEEVQLGFYSPIKNDFKVISKQKVASSGINEVGGLQQTQYDSVEIPREVFVGGKSYSFTERTPVLIDPTTKNLYTKYGDTGVNENVLIEEATQKRVEELEKQGYNTTAGSGLQKGQGSDFSNNLYPYQRDEIALNKGEIGYGTMALNINKRALSGVYNLIKSIVPTEEEIQGGENLREKFGIGVEKGVRGKYDATKYFNLAEENINKYQKDLLKWALTDEATKRKEELDLQYEDIAEKEFRKQYEIPILKGEITQEDAQKRFLESGEFATISKGYQENIRVIENESFNSQKGVDRAKRAVGFAFGSTGLQLSKLSLKLTKTPTRLVTSTAVISGGYGFLKTLPTVVTTTGEIGLFGYGGYKAFSPTASFEERIGGVVTAGIAGGSLGIQAYKYLNTPVAKASKIELKIKNKALDPFEARKVKETRIVVKGTDKTIIKTQFDYNKNIARYVREGRLVSINTRWRSWLKLKPIYSGIPKRVPLKPLGRQNIIKPQTDYQKAIDLLVKRKEALYISPTGEKQLIGISNKYQAQQLIRYTAPRVTEVKLTGSLTTIGNEKTYGVFQQEITRPVITIDKKLGIKTRGGIGRGKYVKIERELLDKVKLKSGTTQSIVQTKQTTSNYLISRSGNQYTNIRDAGKLIDPKLTGTSTSKVYSGKTRVRFDVYGSSNLGSGTTDITLSPYKSNVVVSGSTNRLDATRQVAEIRDYGDIKIAFKEVLDPIRVTQLKPLPKGAFDGSKFSKDVTGDVNKVISKINSPTKPTSSSGSSIRSTTPTQSIYQGTGQYELTQTQSSLLSPPKINLNVPTGNIGFSLKNIIKSNSFFGAKVTGGLLGKELILQKDFNRLGNINFFSNRSNNINNQDVSQKASQDTLTKQIQKLSQTTKTQLTLQPIVAPIIPTFRNPTRPRTQEPIPRTPKPFKFDLPEVKGLFGETFKQPKGVKEIAYLPDFTSRALGLAPEKVTQAQAKKKLQKVLTGLEIRRGVIFK